MKLKIQGSKTEPCLTFHLSEDGEDVDLNVVTEDGESNLVLSIRPGESGVYVETFKLTDTFRDRFKTDGNGCVKVRY